MFFFFFFLINHKVFSDVTKLKLNRKKSEIMKEWIKNKVENKNEDDYFPGEFLNELRGRGAIIVTC